MQTFKELYQVYKELYESWKHKISFSEWLDSNYKSPVPLTTNGHFTKIKETVIDWTKYEQLTILGDEQLTLGFYWDKLIPKNNYFKNITHLYFSTIEYALDGTTQLIYYVVHNPIMYENINDLKYLKFKFKFDKKDIFKIKDLTFNELTKDLINY